MKDDFKKIRSEEENLEKLDRDLYYNLKKKFGYKKRRKLHEKKIELPHDFDDIPFEELKRKKPKRKLPISPYSILFLLSLLIFFIVGTLSFIKLTKEKKGMSNDLISMEILGQPFIDGGEPLRLIAKIKNFNEETLQLPDLVISYQKDNKTGKTAVIRRSLPDIHKGEEVEEKFEIPLFGQEGEKRILNFNLEYRVNGSNSIFVKKANHEVTIRSTTTQVIVSAPEKVVQGQEIIMDIFVKANTENSVRNFLVSIDYPLAFEFIDADPKPKYGNHIWYIEKIPEEGFHIRLKGKIISFPGALESFHIRTGKQDSKENGKIEIYYNHVVHNVEIEKPFIQAKFITKKPSQKVIPIKSDQDVDIEIQYKNALDRAIKNVEMVVSLKGNLHRIDKVSALNAEYNSNTGEIHWTPDSYEQFKEIAAGEEGSISFNIKAKDFLQGGKLINPSTQITLSVYGFDADGEMRKVYAIDQIELRGITKLILEAEALFSEGPFKNLGALPPRVGSKTQYTLDFKIINSSNTIKDAKIKIVFPDYVHWTGKVYPSIEKKNLRYSAITNELIWTPGQIEGGTGVQGKKAKELFIQIEAIPSLSHVGESLPLMREAIIEAKDIVSGVTLKYKKGKVTSLLREDKGKNGLVVE